ncbi:sensor domain-containing diguanylate cyclase [Thermosulfurimonas dismutans]|uniref:sensor domain-containing diguanylate cyclase n=1 Tax=Thermosulfurimonas dismutans TaxID=999894 RepID=UPI00137A68CD|nr:GGDEF domain-containing protein [Thermosulfurimonas dismutans]
MLEKWEKLPSQSAERLLLEASIKELARIGLRGGVYERDGRELVKIYKTASDEEIQAALKAIIENFSIPEVRKNWDMVLKWAINQEEILQKELRNLSERTDYLYILLFLILGFFLIWGALAFFFIVKRPLDRIVSQIQRLLIEGESLCLDDPERCKLKYYANDEIGRLSSAVRDLLRSYGELAQFKHTIEEDQTVEEVYERLAEVFKEKLDLKTFAFYQVSNSQNSMRIMQLSNPDLEVNSEKLFNADLCRAKRTGHLVSSIGQPGVCRLFLWKEEAEHYCVPFMSGGRCVGVAQIILPKTQETRKSKKIHEKLKLAERYIREAVPVIEAKRYAESLKEQTLKDPLTGLYNRRFLEEALDNIVAGILRRGTVLGILMADLDYFKSVNDKYGHDVGDKVLRETAQILKTNVRASDLVVRFGGEEFLILLVDVKEGESVKIAEKLRSLVEAHRFETPKGVLQRTISIGVSEFPVDAQGAWEAIKYADVALYKAKEMGRNRVVRFTPDMWPSEEY